MMNRDVIERILWSLSVDRFSKLKFREDSEKFLARFPLEPADKDMILGFDVKGMQQAGVNPMLTMGYWIEMSSERSMRAYNHKLGSDSEYSASGKG